MISFLVVIVFTPDVVVEKGSCLFSLPKEEGLLVKALLQDGFYAFIGESPDVQGSGAGVFYTFWGVAFG